MVSEKTRLVYILSASHSGSTLLAMLLASHPDITTVGELKANHLGEISRYRCSCGKLIAQCAFWRRICEEMIKRGIDFSLENADTNFSKVGSRYADYLLSPLVRGWGMEIVRDIALGLSPTWRNRYSEIEKRNRVLISLIMELTGAKVIVDSSKLGLRLKYLLKMKDYDIKVIRLIRDGRAVAMTYTDPAEYADASRVDYRDGGCGGNRSHEKKTIKAAAREWRRCNEEAELILSRLEPQKWFEVRYEALCRSTEETLRRIFSFIGVPPMNVMDRYRKKELHILGNGMRLDDSNAVYLDERWKSVLTESDLSIFENEAGKLNRKYGY